MLRLPLIGKRIEETFMFTEIAQNLKTLSEYDGYPAASCREPWEKLPEELRAALIRAGETYLGCEYPTILATDYMEFCRNGNRTRYEDKQFNRRLALNALVLAECAEYKGRFLDDIINGIWLICEESGWQLPAHNTYGQDTPRLPIPDITRPVVDLFAAETGAVLGVTEYLLRDALAKVSPSISVMINHNLTQRIFLPYLSEHFWWMGDGVSHVNNWTSWCTQNVLLAAFTRPDNGIWMPVFQKACKSLDYFLAEYEDDGCCDEGAQYYRHAALTMFNAAEILNNVSGGLFDSVYRDKKIYNMAAYIQNVHVAGPYYINFADCSLKAGCCGVREYLFGKRTGNQSLMRFAARDYQSGTMEQRLDLGEHNTFYRLQSAFCHQEMMDLDLKGGCCDVTSDMFFPSAGLFIARDSRFCLAVKAGDNADSHNHNDTGSFTIYKDGQPLFIDIGVESYTRKTFSPERYDIWTMQSAWHNLPTVGNIMQKDGSAYRATEVEYVLGGAESWISMDIASAYPDDRILSYMRKASLKKGEQIFIRDTFRLAEPMPVVLSLITCEEPTVLPPAESGTPGLSQTNTDTSETWEIQIGGLGVCRITGICRPETEEVPIHDPRLAAAWPKSVYRVQAVASGDSVSMEIF